MLRKENIQTQSGMLCIAALADHIPFYRALLCGISPTELGIATSDDPSNGYLRCHDPTGKRRLPVKSATIIFKITPLKQRKRS